jgi:tetratricopeptide (TPR) repeat protein
LLRREYDKKGLLEYLQETDREIFTKSMSLTHQIYSDTKEDVSNRHIEAERLLVKAIEVFTMGNIPSALYHFEKAFNIENSPLISSYYAFCIAKERGQFSKAISLCSEAIEKEPQNTLLYLNLGRIYHLLKRKGDAVKIFREGLKFEVNQQIIDELTRLGIRKHPVIPFLKRSNPLNKYLGIIFRKLRLR